MTVFVVSLFLPYTIDFQATELRHARRKSSTSQSVDSDRVVGRLAESRRRGHKKSLSLSLTPGATTEDERIFKSYVSHAAGELATADEPNGPGPSDPRPVSWGRSRKFNQPRSKATIPPGSSILSRPEPSDDLVLTMPPYVENALVTPDSEEDHGSPRALLSDDWVVKAAEQGNGGLRNAVNAAEEIGLLPDKMWVGTLGMPTDSLKDATRASIAETLEDEFESLTVFVGDDEFEGHYSHFCRAVLWPAFHYQMQESPRHTEYDDYSWKQYVKVNEAFANTIAANWRPGDSIWIHDYPSSASTVYAPRTNAHKQRSASISLGSRPEEYCYHFLQSCSRLLKLEVSVDGVRLARRFIHVKNQPMGIDTRALDVLREATEVKDWIANIGSRYKGKHLIVARDRLDAPGGIKHKLLAYEMFLKKYPKWRDNVVLIQVASTLPSTGHQLLSVLGATQHGRNLHGDQPERGHESDLPRLPPLPRWQTDIPAPWLPYS
ncbi:predicted protein [Aspergillus terreus NIH2624]|uniref:Uncharacterized protein n=1 Tax=Aspergillus terreus (strain NIH 2624 / FGSC A1156) TaxID=341663 RepID=Q0CRM4_ASPTN|nr:uncharacterized protein ATEG_03660 [Aspergillus terreus NIH2624]EAU35462.1 predicted protein [Aspergillus terreus NIH2624]